VKNGSKSRNADTAEVFKTDAVAALSKIPSASNSANVDNNEKELQCKK
jgi:hypothetical protein